MVETLLEVRNLSRPFATARGCFIVKLSTR